MVKPAFLTVALSETVLAFSSPEHATSSIAIPTTARYLRGACELLLGILGSGPEGSERNSNRPFQLSEGYVRGGKRICVLRLGVEQ